MSQIQEGRVQLVNSLSWPKTWEVLDGFLHYHCFFSYFRIVRESRLSVFESVLSTDAPKMCRVT